MINRRIDRLHDNNLLQSQIVPGGPDDLRDLYIGFKTTEKGCAALQTHLICTDPDCDDVKRPDDHVHDHVPPGQYF